MLDASAEAVDNGVHSLPRSTFSSPGLFHGVRESS